MAFVIGRLIEVRPLELIGNSTIKVGYSLTLELCFASRFLLAITLVATPGKSN